MESDRPKPDASFKIKASLQQINQSQPNVSYQPVVEKQLELAVRQEIDEQKVVAALEKYIAAHHPDPTVAIALKTHRPELAGEKITIPVDNQLQLDKLEVLKIHLQNALMKSLNNGFISVSVKLFDNQTTKEEKRLFTSGEKFEHFITLNPVVADLKVIFGLELE